MTTRDIALHPDRRARLREHLMSELTTLASEQPTVARPARRFTPRRRLLVAGAVAAAVTGATFVGLSTTGGPAGLGPTAFAVTQLPEGAVAIKVVNNTATAKQMTAQLHKQGLSITITTVPSTPQLVGTWVYASFTAAVPSTLASSIAAQEHGYVSTIDISASFPGRITLGVGRATRPGETVQVAGLRNALAPGGLLFCDRLSGVDPQIAATKLAAAGYAVHWAANPVTTTTITTPAAGSKVTEAFIGGADVEQPVASAHDVTLILDTPTDRRYLPQLWTGFAPSQQTAIDYNSCAT
jgi:hypothetical protein